MSSHYHAVLHVRPDIANAWSDLDVVQRWHQIFNGSLFSQRFALGESLSKAERRVLKSDVRKWRARLSDISWFIRIVNESIARQANQEDQCTGRFSVTAPALLYLLHPCSRGKAASRAKPC